MKSYEERKIKSSQPVIDSRGLQICVCGIGGPVHLRIAEIRCLVVSCFPTRIFFFNHIFVLRLSSCDRGCYSSGLMSGIARCGPTIQAVPSESGLEVPIFQNLNEGFPMRARRVAARKALIGSQHGNGTFIGAIFTLQGCSNCVFTPDTT